MKEHLLNLALYNVWANARVIDFLERNVSEEQLNKEIFSSFPSIYKTLFHIWDAEAIWIARLNGNSPTSWGSKSFNGATAEAYTAIIENSKVLANFIEAKEEPYFAEVLHYSKTDGSKHENVIKDMMQHCMNHSTYHRGQIITMLRQLGFTKLFETDYIVFCRTSDTSAL